MLRLSLDLGLCEFSTLEGITVGLADLTFLLDDDLSAENGCFLKAPNSNEWTSTISRMSIAWKPICVEILGYVSITS